MTSERRDWIVQALCIVAALGSHGCGPSVEGSALTADELADPAACETCHPVHVAQWRSSMHAYASIDPVMRAMNARGQQDTKGALGGLCVGCHAPAAVMFGKTTDGLNLAELPERYQGVTCVVCHNAASVTALHNNGLRYADPLAVHGSADQTLPTDAHNRVYSALFDRDKPESSKLCGSCHDVVLASGLELERTYAEWDQSLFASPEAQQRLTCNGCHMRGKPGPIADVDGAPSRRLHDHAMPAVDVALQEFPDAAAQRKAVQAQLDAVLAARLCVTKAATTKVHVELENIGAGHSFPSGATQHRRVWVELVAEKDGKVVWQRGVLDDGEPFPDDPADLWALHSAAWTTSGKAAHMTWAIAKLENRALPAPARQWAKAPWLGSVHRSRAWDLGELAPDRVRMRVRLRPMSLLTLDDLVSSGHLDPTFRAKMPTFDLGSTKLTWTAGDATCVPGGDVPATGG